MHQYYVYILTNWNNRVMYVGVTSDLAKRVDQHKGKLFDGFTKKYHVNKLVYYEMFREINDAIRREKQIKGWTRDKKNYLVETNNPQWLDISSGYALKDSSADASE